MSFSSVCSELQTNKNCYVPFCSLVYTHGLSSEITVSVEVPLQICYYSVQFVFPENAAYFSLSWLKANELENIVLFLERKKVGLKAIIPVVH